MPASDRVHGHDVDVQHVTVARIVGDLWCQSSDPHRLNFMLEGGVASAPDVRFSNRPVGVKHFQTVHHCNVDVTHGLALLSGIGTREYCRPSLSSRLRGVDEFAATLRAASPGGNGAVGSGRRGIS